MGSREIIGPQIGIALMPPDPSAHAALAEEKPNDPSSRLRPASARAAGHPGGRFVSDGFRVLHRAAMRAGHQTDLKIVPNEHSAATAKHRALNSERHPSV